MSKLIFLPAAVLAAAMLSTAVNAQDHGTRPRWLAPSSPWRRLDARVERAEPKRYAEGQRSRNCSRPAVSSSSRQMEAVMTQRKASHRRHARNRGVPDRDRQSGPGRFNWPLLRACRTKPPLVTQVYNLLTDAQKTQWIAPAGAAPGQKWPHGRPSTPQAQSAN